MDKTKGDGNIMKKKQGLVTDKWTTPEWLMNQLNEEFEFDCDTCPIDYVEGESADSLEMEWGARNWVNPPYSNLNPWLEKSYKEYKKDKLICMLLPVRTDTEWFHKWVPKATELRFIKKRLYFGDGTAFGKFPAPFYSCLLIFIPDSMTLSRGVKLCGQSEKNGKQVWTDGCEHFECMF